MNEVARLPLVSLSNMDHRGRAFAKADGAKFGDDPGCSRRLVLAALKRLIRLTDTIVDAAHEAVSFDGAWAINGRSNFRKAVRAMVRKAMSE